MSEHLLTGTSPNGACAAVNLKAGTDDAMAESPAPREGPNGLGARWSSARTIYAREWAFFSAALTNLAGRRAFGIPAGWFDGVVLLIVLAPIAYSLSARTPGRLTAGR